MNKIRMLLTNALVSGLMGALMQIAWVYLFDNRDELRWELVWNMFLISAVIGTTCMFALFYVILKTTFKLSTTILLNEIICFLLLFLVYLNYGIRSGYWNFDFKWIIILGFSTTTTCVLTILWFRKMRLYNQKLEDIKKKNQRK